MTLADAAVSALAQVVLLGGIPLLGYTIYHRWRHERSWSEIARRAGLSACPRRYVFYSLLFALAGVVVVAVSLPVDLLTREGSAGRQFVGLGLGLPAIASALLYGVVQTGFTEELLFRGLIAGSLSRRLSSARANVVQAALFLLPHLLILYVMPEAWGFLPFLFAAALVLGWLRIESGSILGPWLIHASGNVAMALSVASRTAA